LNFCHYWKYIHIVGVLPKTGKQTGAGATGVAHASLLDADLTAVGPSTGEGWGDEVQLNLDEDEEKNVDFQVKFSWFQNQLRFWSSYLSLETTTGR